MADGDNTGLPPNAPSPLPLPPKRQPSRPVLAVESTPEEILREQRRLAGRPAPAPPEVRAAAKARLEELRAQRPSLARPAAPAAAPGEPAAPVVKRVTPPTPAQAKSLDAQIARLDREAKAFQQARPRELSFWDKIQQPWMFVTDPLVTEKARKKVDVEIDKRREKIARVDLLKEGIHVDGIPAREAQATLEQAKEFEQTPDIFKDLYAPGVAPADRAQPEFVRQRYGRLTGEEYGVPMTRTADGKLAFDEGKMRRELTAVFQDRAFRANPDASPVELAEMTLRAEAKAEEELRKIKAVAFDMPFVVDTRAAKDLIMRVPFPPARALLAAMTPSTEYVETGRMTSKSVQGADPLGLIGRLASPLTLPLGALASLLQDDEGLTEFAKQGAQYVSAFSPLGTAYFVTGKWPTAWQRLASEEGVEALMSNTDVVSEVDTIGKRFVEALPESLRPAEREALAARVFGIAFAVGSILVEPDPVSMMGAGAGKAVQATRRAARIAKLDRFAALSGKAKERLEPLFDRATKAAERAQRVEDLDSALETLRRQVRAKQITPADATVQAKDIQDELRAIIDELPKIAPNARKNVGDPKQLPKIARVVAQAELGQATRATSRDLERFLADHGVAYERFIATYFASALGRETGATQQVDDIVARVLEGVAEPYFATQKELREIMATNKGVLRTFSSTQRRAIAARKAEITAKQQLDAAVQAADAARPADKYPELARFDALNPIELARESRDDLRKYLRWHLGARGKNPKTKADLVARIVEARKTRPKMKDVDAALKDALDDAAKAYSRAKKAAEDAEKARKMARIAAKAPIRAIRERAKKLVALRTGATKDFSKELVTRIYKEVGTPKAKGDFQVAALKAAHKTFIEALDVAENSFIAFRDAMQKNTADVTRRASDAVIASATTKTNVKKGTQTVDPTRLLEALGDIPQAEVQRLAARDKDGPLLLRALTGSAPQEFSAAEVARLTDVIERVQKASLAATAPGGREAVVARAIWNAEQRDWNLRPGRTAMREWFPDNRLTLMVDGAIRTAKYSLRKIVASFDPDKSRLGLVAPEVANVYKSFEVFLSQARAELAEFPELSPSLFTQYVDDVDPVQHARGSTWVNSAFGNRTLWSLAREHMMGMFRLQDEARAEKFELEFLKDVTPVDDKGEQVAATAFEALVRAHYGGDVTGPSGSQMHIFREMARKLIEYEHTGKDFASFDAAMKRLLTRAEMPEMEDAVVDGIETLVPTGRYVRVTGLQPLGAADVRAGRTAALQTMAILRGALLQHAEYRFIRALGGSIDVDDAKAANAILTRSTRKLGVTDADEMVDLGKAEAQILRGLDVLERVGGALTQSKTVLNEELREQRKMLKKLIAIHQNADGTVFFLPKNILDEINASTTRIIKELEPQAQHGLDLQTSLKRAAAFLLGAWKTSVTVGYLLPKVRHTMANTGIGDVFGQILFAEGPTQALRTFAQGVPAQFPLYGRLQRPLWARMEKATRDRFGDVPVLNTMTEAMINPDVASLFTGKDGFVRLGGNVVSYERLRQEILEDRILQSVVQEELVEMVNLKLRGGGVSKWLDWWQHEIIAHAELAQQRQRVSFYLDLRRQGATRDEAAKRTQAALYDWKHGFAAWEMSALIRFNVPWYRWARLAMTQAVSTFMEPFVKPTDDYVIQAIKGQTPLSRVLKAEKLRKAVAMWASTAPGEPLMPDDQYDELERLGGLLSPTDWHENRLFYGAPSHLERKAWWLEQGRSVTHTTSVFPSLTLLESSRWLVNAMALPVFIGLDALPGSPLHTTPDAFRLLFADDTLDMLGPMSEFLSAAEQSGLQSGMTWVQPHEARWVDLVQKSTKALPWNWMDDLPETPWVQRDPRTGQTYAPRSVVTMLRLLPVSLQMPSYFRALNEAEIATRVDPQRPFLAAMRSMFVDLYGLKARYDYNVMDGQERRVNEVIRAAREVDQRYIKMYGDPPEIFRPTRGGE